MCLQGSWISQISLQTIWNLQGGLSEAKKIQQQHEGTMKNPLHLLAFSDTVWPRPCLERPLLRRLDGMAKFGLISSRLERR